MNEYTRRGAINIDDTIDGDIRFQPDAVFPPPAVCLYLHCSHCSGRSHIVVGESTCRKISVSA